MIAVCLLTCDRVGYTERTLETFSACNPDQSRFVLIHGDDASVEPTNIELARAHGFRTVVRNQTRWGNLKLRTKLITKAAKLAPWTMILENDIESVRPFPWALFDYVAKDDRVSSLRLFGPFKDRDGLEACLTTHKKKDHAPVKWRPFRGAPEGAQVGDIHWSAQPTVTRSHELLTLHKTGVEPAGLTVRVKSNVMFHIGRERTRPPVLLEAAC